MALTALMTIGPPRRTSTILYLHCHSTPRREATQRGVIHRLVRSRVRLRMLTIMDDLIVTVANTVGNSRLMIFMTKSKTQC